MASKADKERTERKRREYLDAKASGKRVKKKKCAPPDGPRRSGGPVPPKIDLEQLENLCKLLCTHKEIAAFFDVPEKHIEYRKEKDEKFRRTMERGYSRGKMSLRRAQMASATGGNPSLLIWMGKQHLDQRDKLDATITAEGLDAAIKEMERQLGIIAADESGADAGKSSQA